MPVRWVLEDAARPGGVESVARTLAQGLRDLGHDAQVVSWFDEPQVVTAPSAFGWFVGKVARARARSKAAARAAAVLRRDLLADPELVVVLDPGSLAVAHRLAGAPRWGIHLHWSPDLILRPWRHVGGDGIPMPIRPLVALRLRSVAKRNRAVLVQAPFVVTLTPSHTRALGEFRTDVTELPNPASLELSPRRGLADPPRVRVGYLGRVSYEKGPDVFVEAAAALVSEGLVWVLGGSGPLEGALRERIVELGVPVQMVGWVEDTQSFLDHVDVFVLPSRTEAVPLVLAEALAARCQVVATNAGEGVGDVLGGGRLGRIVPPESVSSLASAITEAAAEARAGAQPAEEEVRRLVERHRPEAVLRGWEALLFRHVERHA